MEGPDSIKKPSIDPLRMMGAGAVKKVSGNSAPVGSGKGPEILGNGATVSGSGKSEAAAGQALLGMMAKNDIVPTNGFFKGKVQEKPVNTNVPDINLHTAALLLDGTEADNQFKELMTRASRGAEFSSGKASPREIEGRQAVIMPLDGPDAHLGAALRLAFNSADRQGPVTTEAIINSFHASSD
jgi:hypothetical protein